MAANAPKRKVVIEVISDTVCPWCYVGKRRLEQAMSAYSDKLDFEVHWLPFQLAPDAPKKGVNKLQMYLDKFGPRVEAMLPAMKQTYAELGLEYSIGGLTGNTLDSHRLIDWAGKTAGPAVQNALVEELFANYFTQEKYIGDPEVLLAAAEKVGLDVAAARAVLSDPQACLQEVNAGLARGRGVGGVPFFIVDKKYKISGAQPPATFTDLFDTLLGQ